MTTQTPVEDASQQQGQNRVQKPNELPILVGDGLVARIPFPMTADDFELLIGTLNLWKKRIVRENSDDRLS